VCVSVCVSGVCVLVCVLACVMRRKGVCICVCSVYLCVVHLTQQYRIHHDMIKRMEICHELQ
jgi:hypothetical protein